MEKKVILIVDDSAVDTHTYKRYQGSFPHGEWLELRYATTGEEALVLYPSLQPDCVLMDYRLPDTDGLTLLTQLQAIAPKETLCVVVVTGAGSERLAVQALQEGALDYLIKGEITAEMLVKAVRNAIDRNELRQQVAHQQQQLVGMNHQRQRSLEELQQVNEALRQSQQQEQAARSEAERQRQAAENALLKIQALLKAATEVAVFATDLRGTITLFNPGAEKMLGYTAQEVIGLQTPELLHLPEEVQAYRAGLSAAEQAITGFGLFVHQANQGAVNVREWTYRTKEGQHRNVRLIVNRVYGWDGQPEGYLGIATDITEQKRNRQALQESARRMQQILDSIPHLIWSADVEGHCTFLNRQWQEYAALDVSEPARMNFISLVHKADKQHILKQEDLLLKTGQPFQAPFRLRSHSGEYRWMMGRTMPVFDQQGELIERVSTATDIHEQKMAQDALEESEKRFRFITNAIPQIVWTATPDGKLDYFSQQWYDYSHYDFQQSRGLGWASAIHPADRPGLSKHWSHSLRTGQLHQAQARMRRADGVYRWQLIRALPLRSEQGAITQWMGTCTDLQDQKYAEQELKELAEELAASNEELGEANKEIQSSNVELGISNGHLTRTNVDLDNFIYAASHDLRTPISNIEGLLSVLLRTLPPESLALERVKRIISMMQDSVERFKRTVGHLTEVVKLQKQNSGEDTLVDVAQVIRDVTLDLEPLIQSSGIQLVTELTECPQVCFTEKNLRSVVYNLLSNSMKYRSPERVLRVLFRCESTPSYHLLSVTDNGLGLETQQMGQLFTMFRRFHDHVEGTGIGLYMVKKMVENAGGKIEVESQLGQGSTFKVYFPVNGFNRRADRVLVPNNRYILE